MKLFNFIILAIIMCFSCVNKTTKEKKIVKEEKVREVLIYFIEDLLPYSKVNVLLSPKFEYYLQKNDFDSLLYSSNYEFKLYRRKRYSDDTIIDSLIPKIIWDRVINKNNVKYMEKQYFYCKENYNNLLNNIIDVDQPKYKKRFSREEPENNEMYYVMSPPLFTKKYNYAVIYVKSLFRHKGDYKEDDLYFIFRKLKNDNWEIFGFIRNANKI